MENFLNTTILNNTVAVYLQAALLFLIIVAFFRISKEAFIRRLKSAAEKTKNDFDDFLVDSISKLNWPLFVVTGLYVASRPVQMSEFWYKASFYAFVIFLAVEAVKVINNAIDYTLQKTIARRRAKEDAGGAALAQTIGGIMKIVVWVIAILVTLSNFGVNVGSLLAGLGIGGIAVALAAQSIFKDAFSALTIYLDRPFQVGDFIVFEGSMGTVKKIGIKSTRIQTLQGEELIVSNSALTEAKVQNFKRMKERRIEFTLGVTYETSLEKLKKVPDIILNIMKGVEGADLDRCHFKEFADFSLNFEIVYFVKSADYNEYMNIQQSVNLAIKNEFEKEGIEMAYPTSTVYVNKIKD